MSRLTPRKGMPSPRLNEDEFRKRFLAQFQDPAFDSLGRELDSIAAAAWDAYSHSRKAPRTRKAGAEFADPDYELSLDWLAARAAIADAQRRHADRSKPAILLINCSSRSEHTCPGEMSKSYRLVEIAREVFTAAPGVAIELLDLSRLASEYGRHIHPCKACFSTAAALCHWPCSCYPNYSLGQTQDWINDIYPLWVVAHGIMIVTPVNWYQASSPLMMDRLVCADGGNPDPTRTQGKNAELAKQIELEGWDYPRHLSGRLFSVVVHGDVEGAEKSGAAFPTGCALWIFVPPDLPPSSTATSAIGSPTPLATPSSMPIPRSRRRYATRSALCSRRCAASSPARSLPPARICARRGRNSRAAPPKPNSARSAYTASSFIFLMALSGPRQPRNCNFFDSSASVASKNFSSSSIALAGRRRMSCRSPSKGERPGTTNTRSLRSFLPFDDWTTSSTPIGLHFSTRPG